MKAKIENSKRPDILGNGEHSSVQDVLTATLKRWRPGLGYCSIFAAVPAILASNIPVAHSDETRDSQVSVAAETPRFHKKQNRISGNPALLKRQSEFLLPHQRDSFALPAAVAGVDDCPGQAIPGGSYTAAAPYVVSGDTTGANDTITAVPSYYYYYFNYSAHGPDHVYSFTITGFGPDPKIEVSTTSGTYKPLIYVLRGDSANACPAGTANTANNNMWAINDSRWNGGGSNTATVYIAYLPKNVPFHLFVDSQINDGAGAGPYTIKMKDVTISPAPACGQSNPIDCGGVFIRQQYLDFLNREPENDGLQFYMDILNGCGPSDTECVKYTRGALSANFFRSPEFQSKGGYVANLYNITLGQRAKNVPELGDFSKVERPHYAEFTTDLASLTAATDAETNTRKNQLAVAFLQRPEVQQNLPNSLTNQQFVQKLESIAGVTLANESTLIANLNNSSQTRAQVLRTVAESAEVVDKFYKPNFVTMEYFGYLHRDPEDCHDDHNWVGGDPFACGYFFHNSRFNLSSDADLVENLIVRGFIESPEYRHRFGP